MIGLTPLMVSLHLIAVAVAAPVIKRDDGGFSIANSTNKPPVSGKFWCDLETEFCYPNPQDYGNEPPHSIIKRNETSFAVADGSKPPVNGLYWCDSLTNRCYINPLDYGNEHPAGIDKRAD